MELRRRRHGRHQHQGHGRARRTGDVHDREHGRHAAAEAGQGRSRTTTVGSTVAERLDAVRGRRRSQRHAQLQQPGRLRPSRTSSPGSQYTLSENPNPGTGYSSSGEWSCDGGVMDATNTKVTVALGAQVTCTIVNTDDTPQLKLVKSVVNDNGGTAVADNWTLYAAAAAPNERAQLQQPGRLRLVPERVRWCRVHAVRESEPWNRLLQHGSVELRRRHPGCDQDQGHGRAGRARHLHDRQQRHEAAAEAGQVRPEQRRRHEDRRGLEALGRGRVAEGWAQLRLADGDARVPRRLRER